MRFILYFTFSLFVLNAYPTVHTNFKHYSIYPQTKEDLGKAMYDNSPIRLNGKKHRGLTQWRIKWSYKWKKRNNTCYITKANVILNIDYTMPKIPTSHTVDASVRNTFDAYYKALFAHEKNHMKYAEKAARDLERRILSFRGKCNDIKPYINKEKTSIFNKLKKVNKDYDKRTGQGRTEGVDVKNFF